MFIKVNSIFNQADVLSATSAVKKEENNTMGSFLPVSLDNDQMREFRTHFHPKKRDVRPKRARGSKEPKTAADRITPQGIYVELALYMTEVSAYLEAVYAGLRVGFQNHEYWKDSGKDVGAEVSNAIEHYYTTATALPAVASRYIGNMQVGSQHIIRASERFPNGMDAILVGQRGATKSSLIHATIPNPPAFVPYLKSTYSIEVFNGNAASAAGKAFIEDGWDIQKAMFPKQGLSDVKSTYSRIFVQHRIGLFHQQMLASIEKILKTGALAKQRIAVQLPVFKRSIPVGLLSWLDKYNSILVVREPDVSHVNAKINAGQTPDESLDVNIQGLALQPAIAFSFALNIPKNFVEYIVQSKDVVPLASLNTYISVWRSSLMKPPGSRGSGNYAHRIPQYVLLPSKSEELSKRRQQLGFYSEQGRVNKDNLYITDRGNLSFLPKQDEATLDNAKKYEQLLEECLKTSYDTGAPLITSQEGSAGAVYDIANPEYKDKIRLLKGQLSNYCGGMQVYNWDLNCLITTSLVSPDNFVSTKLVGCSRPDELNIASYMRGTFAKSMCNMFGTSYVLSGKERISPNPGHFGFLSNAIDESSIFSHFASAYNMLLNQKLVPDLGELIKRAAAALKVTSLRDEIVAPFEISRFDSQKTIYEKFLTPELQYKFVGDEKGLLDNTGKTILYYLSKAADDASAGGRSNLAAYCVKENVDPIDTGRYFVAADAPTHEFANLFQYFGGQVFLQAMKAVAAVPSKDLMVVSESRNPKDRETFAPFTAIQSEVIPFCIMFSKYITDLKEAILQKADEIADNNSHPKFSEDELNIAGSRGPVGTKPGMQLFPHQAEALSILKNHPRIAILDIAPGGGKTTIGIADIAMSYADGLIKRPFIICPNGLVGNWAEDIHKHMEGRWNVIPITTATYSDWGDEKLTEMIKNAPGNTIVVVGNSFLSSRGAFQLVLGNHVERVSDSLEFCKKFQPDYIFLDESHRVRNTKSALHRYVKSLTQMSSLKFGRIGTGTFIQNVLSDAVGQTAIFNAQVFRTKNEFDTEHKDLVASVDGQQVLNYTPEAPGVVKRRLSEFATVISYKRKEWAFMLPLPIETFISVDFEDVEDKEIGRQHKMFYDAVLKTTMEELINDKNIKSLMKPGEGEDGEGEEGDGDDGGDDDGDEGGDKVGTQAKDHKITTKNGKTIDVSDEDEETDNLDALEAALQPYLQRLERILTDPLGDEDLAEVAKAFFGDVKREDFVTAKVRKIVDRIKMHFTPNEWQRGKEYKSSDIVDFNGSSFILRPSQAQGETTYKSNTSPDQDTENWLPQHKGKVMVFCRFTRSVDAIYRALPPALRKRAVVFHGEVKGNKWDNLDRFKTDDAIDILIANEMGISEGHNLQMASRFIRAESPWAPGELDQSSSRIFRPDVGGKYKRQTIFMDWIITDGTLEVAKMGRLISKMLCKAKFDELDNPKYYKDLNPLNLPVIKMSLDNLRVLNKMEDLCSVAGVGGTSAEDPPHSFSYIGQYHYLVSEMASEFREMKKTKRAYMIDVKPTPLPEEAKVIEFTPWVPNMKVPDRHDEGLQSLRGVLQEDDHPLTMRVHKEGPSALIGQYVRTEYGIGVIKSALAMRKRVTTDEDGDEASDVGVSKVRVELSQGGNVESLSPSKVFLATKITEKSQDALNAKAPKIGDGDKKRTAKQGAKAKILIARGTKKATDFGKKILDEKKKPKSVKAPVVEEPDEVIDISLYPVVYSGYLALEAVPEDSDVSLKKYGFKPFGNYAYLPIKNYANFTKVLDFLESKYTLSSKTIRHLDALHDSFQSGRGRKFDIELAPLADMPKFYRTRHTLTAIVNKRKPELKVYPVILNANLMLVVDIATNPVVRKQIGKSIPGTSPILKFDEADGLELGFFNTKRELKACVKQLRLDGYNILNIEELNEEVDNLDLKQLGAA